MKRTLFWAVVLILGWVVWTMAAARQTATVTATWDANSDPYTVGYRLYYGTAPGAYQWSLDTGPAVSAQIALSPGTYYFGVRAYDTANNVGPLSNEVALQVGAPVDCTQGTWSNWTPSSAWSACSNGSQFRTETRTFTPTAATCPPSTDTRTVTQPCTVTTPSCAADPLSLTMKPGRWPADKHVRLPVGSTDTAYYTSDYPIASYVYATRGNTVTAITFTDERGCKTPPIQR